MKDNTSQEKKNSNAVANQVVQKKSNGKSLPSRNSVQMKKDDELLQETASKKESTATRTSTEMTPSGKLPASVQMKMESSFGHDFSDVNIHANSTKASALGANAYAQGTDLHFASGKYNPQSSAGQKLIGHELTHVVQQRQGKVSPTETRKGVSVNTDASLESEADKMGDKAASHASTNTGSVVQGKFNSSSSAPVQMDEASGTVSEEDMKELLSQQEKQYIEAVSPGSMDDVLNPVKRFAGSKENEIAGATGAGGIGSNAPDLLTGLSGGVNDDSFSKASKDAKGNTAGLGAGSAGVISSAAAVGGLAASVGGGAGQIYGAYGDQKEGKFDKKKGGKGWKSMLTGAGRGLTTAGDITTNALKTTQAISAVTGNAGSYGAAAAGLGPMAMITSGFQGVKGVHNAVLNKAREAKAEDMINRPGINSDQKKLFEDLAKNKKEKKQKGMVDAALGATGMVAAGLMLNPVTAPAGLAIGAALGLGQGAFALFKAVRQKGRDSAHDMSKKAAMTPEAIIAQKREEYTATKEANANSKLPWKKYAANKAAKKLDKLNANPGLFGAAKSEEYTKSSNRLNSVFNKDESSEKQKENRDKMATTMMGLGEDIQQEAMSGIMGINKFDKDDKGGIKKGADGKPVMSPYFKTQILKIQADYIKKFPKDVVAKKAKELSTGEGRFSSELNVTTRLAAALGMDETAAEKEMLSNKLK
jgi:hypothetical protein